MEGPLMSNDTAKPSDAVKACLINVLKEVQETSGLECPDLAGDTRPVESLPKFNSKVWAVATSLLADQIGAVIPNDANIFFNKTTKKALSIDETVELVCQLLNAQQAAAVA
jgi:hypothetical protein